jgi:putative acetyltransferase
MPSPLPPADGTAVPAPVPAIAAAAAPDEIAAVRELIAEYQVSLGVDLEFQGFSAELAGLPGGYAPPRGALYLATLDGVPVGCVAVRPIDDRACEMKRLYVRPAGRGHGLGRALAERAIAHARAAGFAQMLLDTLPTMGDAQALYARLGFVDVPPYRANPIAGTRFLSLDLSGAGFGARDSGSG